MRSGVGVDAVRPESALVREDFVFPVLQSLPSGRECLPCVAVADHLNYSRQTVEEAARDTAAVSFGFWHARLFAFVRRLKGMAWLAGAFAADLDFALDAWLAASDAANVKVPRGQATKAFAEKWGDAIFAEGAGPLHVTLARVKAEPLPPEAAAFDGPAWVKVLVAFCKALHENAGPGGVWFLSVRKAGELFNVHYSSSSRWLKQLRKNNIIALTERGTRRTGRASCYRYVAGQQQQSAAPPAA